MNNAKNASAKGLIVINTSDDEFDGNLTEAADFPISAINFTDGQLVINALNEGSTIVVEFKVKVRNFFYELKDRIFETDVL
jgi:hypothetical protein